MQTGKSLFRTDKKRLWALGLAAALHLAGLQPPAAANSDEGCLTGRINSERQAQGARSLSTSSSLVAIARRHSARMAEDQRYYHNSNLRNELPSGWRTEGENVGWATDCAHMHNFFINSPSHRKNILNPAFNQIGVGVVIDSAGKLWVTEVFVESSDSPGFSTDSKAALKAPPPATPPAAVAASEPSPPPTQNTTSAGTAQKAPSPRASETAPKTSNAASAPVPKKSSQAVRKEAGAQTLAYQDILESEPGWRFSGLDEDPIVFDLEQSV